MSEAGDGKGEVARQQFLPGTKVEVRVSYFTHGENLRLRIENESGETVDTSGPLVMSQMTRFLQPQLAYPIQLVQAPGGGLREELPPQYYARGDAALMGTTGPDKLTRSSYVKGWSRFECPKVLGHYLVVLDRADHGDMQRLKTYQFSVVSTL